MSPDGNAWVRPANVTHTAPRLCGCSGGRPGAAQGPRGTRPAEARTRIRTRVSGLRRNTLKHKFVLVCPMAQSLLLEPSAYLAEEPEL